MGFHLHATFASSASQLSSHTCTNRLRQETEGPKPDVNKTQCQPCKRLAGLIIPFFLVWFGLERRFTVDVISRGQSTTIFLCIRPFSAW